MGAKEKVNVFYYKSGNSQGILIGELGMNTAVCLVYLHLFDYFFYKLIVSR